jgi:hypothetical protein
VDSSQALQVLVAVATLGTAVGCDRSSAAGVGEAGWTTEDRTLQRLREEVATRAEAQTDRERLAAAATAPPSAAKQALPLPGQPRTALGPLQLEVVALAASQVVEGEKVSLATGDRFLRIQLLVKNGGRQPAEADLTQAVLVGSGQRTWGIARDVQRLAGTKLLQSELAPGESRDFVLFFEVPQAALAGGLRLWAAGAGARAGGNEDGVISLE